MAKQIKFFIDFDGTITQDDVVDMILSTFATSEWQTIEREWTEGKIGSRECLSRQMGLVSMKEESLKELLQEVKVDPYFVDFMKLAKRQSIPVAIVSDGFDTVIETVLKKAFRDSPGILEGTQVFSNGLKPTREGYQVVFPDEPVCEHFCANCKPRVITGLKKEGDFIIFVGDGLSDRFAAQASDLTFAKNKLLQFCEHDHIPHERYSNFNEVVGWLGKRLSNENGTLSLRGAEGDEAISPVRLLRPLRGSQ